MAWTQTESSKCCLTCANWGGDRSVRPSSSTAETDSPSERGECYEGVYCNVSDGQRACDGRNCSKYEKWSALKK